MPRPTTTHTHTHTDTDTDADTDTHTHQAESELATTNGKREGAAGEDLEERAEGRRQKALGRGVREVSQVSPRRRASGKGRRNPSAKGANGGWVGGWGESSQSQAHVFMSWRMS